jgi:sporulation protein YqfC
MKKERIGQRIALVADLPDATVPALPLIEIAGESRVLIENHFGVTQYSRETICVKVKFGQVCVDGFALELARMTKGQLVVTGRIDRVCLLRG